jgi:hypothetical protein
LLLIAAAPSPRFDNTEERGMFVKFAAAAATIAFGFANTAAEASGIFTLSSTTFADGKMMCDLGDPLAGDCQHHDMKISRHRFCFRRSPPGPRLPLAP